MDSLQWGAGKYRYVKLMICNQYHAISQKHCNVDAVIMDTNRKSHMLYWMAKYPMTLTTTTT